MRVEPEGAVTETLVQFYRTWLGDALRRTSPKAFPDLEVLRTWQLLAERRALSSSKGLDVPAPPAAAEGAAPPATAASSPRARRVARRLGFGLALLAVLDRLAFHFSGISLVDLSGAVLLVGAAGLLAAPSLRMRR